MGRRINMMLEHCLASVEFWELQYQAIRNVSRALDADGGREDKELHAAMSVIHLKILGRMHYAYSELFAAANFGTEEQQRAARKLAYKKYFREGMSLIRMFNDELGLPPHVQPSKWPSGLEEELRKEIEAEMEKEG